MLFLTSKSDEQCPTIQHQILSAPPTQDNTWYGPNLSEDDWLITLTDDEVHKIDHAASIIASKSNDTFIFLDALGSLVLPVFTASRLESLVHILHHGNGFFILRGLPIISMSKQKIAAAFLVVSSQFGNLRMQNAAGDVLGHVTDLGLSSSDPNVRVYQTRERQTFHIDSCDVVGLLCINPAKQGGDSAVVHSGTIFNEMMLRAPDLAKLLLEPIPTDRRGEVPHGAKPYYMIPVYSYFGGYLSAFYQRQYIDSSQRFPDAPRLTEQHVAALDLFDALANDPSLHFTTRLEPGDMQFIHNYNLLHDRSAFVDYDDASKKRHLLRTWIATPQARPLPPVYAERYGSITIGDRGGVNIPGTVPIASVIPLRPK